MHVIVQESFKSHFHTHSCTFCTKELHKGVHVHSLHMVLCLYTHLHLVSWYSQYTLFWWGCRCMRWVVLCLCVKNITRAFRCHLYSFQLSRQEARLISLVSCPLKSRMHCVLQDLSFLSLALSAFSVSCDLKSCLQPVTLTQVFSSIYFYIISFADSSSWLNVLSTEWTKSVLCWGNDMWINLL